MKFFGGGEPQPRLHGGKLVALDAAVLTGEAVSAEHHES
jgi:hypothetical protein